MKTTLDIPDDLMRAVKIRAAEENRRLKDVVAELLARGLEPPSRRGSATVRRRAKLPLVKCVHAAASEREMTPERVAEVLLEQEVRAVRDPLR